MQQWLTLARVSLATEPIVRLAEMEVAFRTGQVKAARDRATQLVRSITPDDPLASRIYLRAGQISREEVLTHGGTLGGERIGLHTVLVG